MITNRIVEVEINFDIIMETVDIKITRLYSNKTYKMVYKLSMFNMYSLKRLYKCLPDKALVNTYNDGIWTTRYCVHYYAQFHTTLPTNFKIGC